jgi:hypothetical protein
MVACPSPLKSLDFTRVCIQPLFFSHCFLLMGSTTNGKISVLARRLLLSHEDLTYDSGAAIEGRGWPAVARHVSNIT